MANDRFISDETLLGYLLDALNDSELESVESELALNSHLRIRLESLRGMLFPLAEDIELFEPPTGLSDRVMDSIDDAIESPQTISSSAVSPISENSDVRNSGGRSSRGWTDFAVSCVAAVVAISIFSPALLRTQEGSRAAQCAGNLRELGELIRDYASNRLSHQIPEVDVVGPLSFAGIYAIRLNEAGLLNDRKILWCPDNKPEHSIAIPFLSGHTPNLNQIADMSPARLEVWQSVAGGSYSYNLGVMKNGQHQTPSLMGRTHFALMADAPRGQSTERPSLATHSGVASNILYEDGRIQLMRFDLPLDLEDHPYWNHDGENLAGIDANDSALGPSKRNPLQRNIVPIDLPRQR